MIDSGFKYLVFFDSSSSKKFSTFSKQETKNNLKGRKAVEYSLKRKKSIKTLFKELPGNQSVAILKSGGQIKQNKSENLVLPFPKVEAMAVEKLDKDQIDFLRDRGALVMPNTNIRRLTHVRKQDLKHEKPNTSMAWQVAAVLGNTPRENVGRGIRFGVVDTGANIKHPEFF